MQKKGIAEHLKRYHRGEKNAVTSRVLEEFDTEQTRLPLDGGGGP